MRLCTVLVMMIHRIKFGLLKAERGYTRYYNFSKIVIELLFVLVTIF